MRVASLPVRGTRSNIVHGQNQRPLEGTDMSNTDPQPRQRLLYLQARTPSVLSEIIGLTQIEPVPGFTVEISASEVEWPYQKVHDAVVDGWQIVQFPHLQAPFDDRDLDVVGYEFILQKMEAIDA